MIDNVTIRLTHGFLSMASCADLTTESGSFWIEAAIDCLLAVSDGMISVECRHTNFNPNLRS